METAAERKYRFTLRIGEVVDVKLVGKDVILDIEDGNGNLCALVATPHVVLSGIGQCQKALVGKVVPWPGAKQRHAVAPSI